MVLFRNDGRNCELVGKAFLKSVFEQKVEKKGYFQQFWSAKELLLITFGKLWEGGFTVSSSSLLLSALCLQAHSVMKSYTFSD